jgi:hypothetical protein
MSKSKNDDAWDEIFKEYQIINKLENSDHVLISSDYINKVGKREARLMTKFDHKSQLPKLFADNNLSILPVSRGGYIIGVFETFHVFNQGDDVEIRKISFPPFLESLDHENITSEAIAISCAFASGIIQDFTGENNLCPTVNGRMSSSSFDFSINSNNGVFNVSVENSQIEIDGGYEGESSLSIIEAKNHISDDFLIRQLFYPYKLWVEKVSKKVRPIFLSYTNGVFHLREYIFTDSNYYNSIKLVNQRKYAFQAGVINTETIQKISSEVKIVDEPEIPFPQANSFDRVINLCELLEQKNALTIEEITLNYDFASRQAKYYSDAGKYLGLLECRYENDTVFLCLTRKGADLFSLSIFDRQNEFIKLILSHAVFNNTLRTYFRSGRMPSQEDVVSIMYDSNLYNINSDSTYIRRSSTIVSWINWIVDLIEE